MRQVAAVLEVHGQDRVAGLEEGCIDREVRRRTRVRLQVGVVSTEQTLGAFAANLLGDVDIGAPAVVPATRVSLGVLVGQRRAGGGEYRRRCEVLARDELQSPAKAVQFVE